MPNESAKIILAATHGKLTKVKDALAVEGTINALKVSFQFATSDWNDTTKTAVFLRGRATSSTINEQPVCRMLDENNECNVPPAILTKEGMFSVGVFGTRDNYRIVSNWMCYRIDDGCYADGSEPIDPSSTIYEQIISMLNNKSDVSHNHDDRYSTKPKSATITLLAANWVGDASPYSQVITIPDVTSKTMIDLLPTPAQLATLQANEITLMMVNDDGVVTAYALNAKPIQDYEIPIVITETR